MDSQKDDELVYEEDQIEEYAQLVYAAAVEHGAPNFAIDLAGHGLRGETGFEGMYYRLAYRLDADGLHRMAQRWREIQFDPPDFADRIERLADAVEEGE